MLSFKQWLKLREDNYMTSMSRTGTADPIFRGQDIIKNSPAKSSKVDRTFGYDRQKKVGAIVPPPKALGDIEIKPKDAL